MSAFLKGLVIAAAPLLLAGAAAAQGGGGGGDTPSTNAEVAYCIPRGADGAPVRKLSSEEICPTYQFWREDCRRDGQLGLVNDVVRAHCGAAALGLRDADIATGSIRPAAGR